MASKKRKGAAKRLPQLNQVSVALAVPATVQAVKEPCAQCPFRRAGMAGWLGESDPESFIETTMADYPMPCHQTIDYADPDWKEHWEAGQNGKLCAGALSFFANIGKLSRERGRPRRPEDETVFSSAQEFCDHHNGARVKSWKMKF